MRQGIQLYYRGGLRFCNYTCSYCPFSKNPYSERQLSEDQDCLERFVRAVEEEDELKETPFALLIVPYGEALIHRHYWKAMARLSRLASCRALGCQTNLSFPVREMAALFSEFGGRREKLKLWCSYHPSMVSREAFAAQAAKLAEAGIGFSAGSVGDPAAVSEIEELRWLLPDTVYLWVNRLDERGKRGRAGRREVSRQEGSPQDGFCQEHSRQKAWDCFRTVDPLFSLEQAFIPADGTKCKDAFFICGNGEIFPCNLSGRRLGNFYEPGGLGQARQERREMEKGLGGGCGCRECSCFLAYCNRVDLELSLLGEFPAFRNRRDPSA